MPVSGRTRTLAMSQAAIGHGDARAVSHVSHGCAPGRELADIALDRFPDEEQLPATEGSDVVNTLQQHRVFQTGTDGPGVVVDSGSQFVGGQVSLHHLLLVVLGQHASRIGDNCCR